jgi:NAD(P)-dependent dehydrogenase (short-subunit alcohol dehydrogenase family)
MNESLTNKCAIVTGGSKGIGFEIAKALHASRTHVLIVGRNETSIQTAIEAIKKTSGAGEVTGVAADVSDPTAVEEVFRTADQLFTRLDILVNNAGIGIFKPTADISVAEWDRLIATNLSGAFYCSREAVSRFRHSGGGHIINVSSLAGKNPFAGGAAYNASKFGMNGFSEAMMLDHRAENIRVSYIMPGSVDTEFSGRAAMEKSGWKIAPEDIAEIVIDVLRMPERTLISRVEVRPSRPKKD